MTLDAPFDIRLLRPEQRELPSTESLQSRLLLEVHGIDERGILRALRGVSLSPELTREFLAAVMDQLASSEADTGPHARWQRHEPVELVRSCTMTVCGQ